MDRIAAGRMTASLGGTSPREVMSNGDIVRADPDGVRSRPRLSHGQAVPVPRFEPVDGVGSRCARVAGLVVALAALERFRGETEVPDGVPAPEDLDRDHLHPKG